MRVSKKLSATTLGETAAYGSGDHRVRSIGQNRSAHLDAAINEIVRMAGVTNSARRTRLRSEITRVVKKLWHCVDPKILSVRKNAAERSKAAITRALSARSAFEKAAVELKLAFDEFDELYGKLDRILHIEGYSPSPVKTDARGVSVEIPQRTEAELLEDIAREFPERTTDELLDQVLIWAKEKPPLVSVEPRLGRPRANNLDFFYFVCVLSSVIQDAGGKLTLDKNYPEKASLPRALQLLRPHLPEGFIPIDPSVRMLFEARQGAARPLILGLARSRLSR